MQDRLSPALTLNLKTTRAGPEEKREGGGEVLGYWHPLAPITAETRKADHLGASQSESCGREAEQHRLFFS